MASSSISKSDGAGRVQFFHPNGKRKTIYLGRISKRGLQAVHDRVEALVAAKRIGHPVDDFTANWLRSLDDWLYDKLVRAGLAPERGG